MLWSGPTNIQDRKKYLVSESEYDVDAISGNIIFKQPQATGTYVYVTLDNNYLRNANKNNQLCLDCHITATHEGNDCTVCHASHGSNNLFNVRNKINGRDVSFGSTTAMGGPNGVCTVCHTTTIYHNATAITQQPHYNNQECMSCHPHNKGFPSYTTVLENWVDKLLALVGFKDAYAAPASLGTYSVSGSSPLTFKATATVQTQTSQSSPQTVTTDVIYYYHNDHLGTPSFMSDESGKVVWRREQTPYGEDTLQRGTITENLRMPGQYYDAETGMNDNGFRTYNPKIGGYMEADPIGQLGDVNPFSYVDGNPTNWIDFLGLCGKKKCVGYARVLKGNARTIGKQGAFPKVKVAAGTAAIIPDQFGGMSNKRLRPYIKDISGTSSAGVSFNGVTEEIGGDPLSDYPNVNVREGLKMKYPGLLILELPSAKNDPGIVDIELTIPDAIPCPTGTKEKK